jgi:hypothetical protein
MGLKFTKEENGISYYIREDNTRIGIGDIKNLAIKMAQEEKYHAIIKECPGSSIIIGIGDTLQELFAKYGVRIELE